MALWMRLLTAGRPGRPAPPRLTRAGRAGLAFVIPAVAVWTGACAGGGEPAAPFLARRTPPERGGPDGLHGGSAGTALPRQTASSPGPDERCRDRRHARSAAAPAARVARHQARETGRALSLSRRGLRPGHRHGRRADRARDHLGPRDRALPRGLRHRAGAQGDPREDAERTQREARRRENLRLVGGRAVQQAAIGEHQS